MKFIIKFFPEINIKSSSVRKYFIKSLFRNIRIVLNFFTYVIKIKWYWDYIEILIDRDDFYLNNIVTILTRIPGIHHVFLVEKYIFKDMFDVFEKIIPIYKNKLVGKSFCVRVKRYGIHNFSSQDLECYLGDMLCKNIKGTFVRLVNAEEVIRLEVKKDYFLLLKNRYQGLCGFPIGTQGEVLSLISGGFDSGISSYMLIRRGCKVHYCFFNLGGDLHENSVYKIAYYLWEKFGSSHSVKFISVDFSCVLNEILENINSSYRGIILKRMMIRAAGIIAKHLKIPALITGEVLGQVSSQTLINLKLINDVTDLVIFRPLISYDKEDIISLSRKIGIEHFSIGVPEYCGIISRKPTAKGSVKFIELEEKKFDFAILYRSIDQRKMMSIDQIILEKNYNGETVKFISKLDEKYIVIDIRSQEEEEVHPLNLNTVSIYKIPFYKLSNVFSTLDQNKTYLLYCGRGVMSHLHVVYLRNQGFTNVHVYSPS